MIGPTPVRLLFGGDVIQTRDGDEATIVGVYPLARYDDPGPDRVELSYITADGLQSLDLSPDAELMLLRTASEESEAAA